MRSALALLAALASSAGVAFAATPAAPPGGGCAAATTAFSNSTPVATADGVAVTSTIVVSGLDAYLLDVDLATELQHTWGGDLEVTLTSPGGTVVTVTTDNGGSRDDIFDGRAFDDGASPGDQVPYAGTPAIVTDHAYLNGVSTPPLTSEEPLAAFVGEDPNGTWTLTVYDDAVGEGGSLNGWALDLTTLRRAPSTAQASFSNTTPTPLADAAVTTSSIVVGGLETYVLDLDVTTSIRHTFSADLDVTLTSPGGTVVTLTTDNGAGNDDVFDGTVWDDSADPGSTVPYAGSPNLADDHELAYSNDVTATPLAPEEALGAFIGEDPNGTWTLTVSDDAAVDIGTLDDWTLDFTTASCPRRVIRVL